VSYSFLTRLAARTASLVSISFLIATIGATVASAQGVGTVSADSPPPGSYLGPSPSQPGENFVSPGGYSAPASFGGMMTPAGDSFNSGQSAALSPPPQVGNASAVPNLVSAPLQGGVEQRSVMMPPPQQGFQSQVPAFNNMNTMYQGSTLQNALMPQWMPAYMKALSDAMPPAPLPPLQANVDTNVVRPGWIVKEAYTNGAMVTEYHANNMMWWNKQPIPEKPQWMLLSSSVLKYWNGRQVEPCWIHSIPDQAHPGSFIFSSNYPGGPKGWLQATGQMGRWGFPQYRYWFDPR